MKTREGKQEILRALEDALPADATLEDAIDYLYYLHQIDEGLKEADAGEMIPHEDVMREIDQWLK
jgi:predicted transcriptional regulator